MTMFAQVLGEERFAKLNTDVSLPKMIGRPFTSETGRAAAIASGVSRYQQGVARRLLTRVYRDQSQLADALLAEAVKAEQRFITERTTR